MKIQLNWIELNLTDGVYPSILKLNNVIPIFQKGKKSDVLNYRGISNQPISGKIFEYFVQYYVSHKTISQWWWSFWPFLSIDELFIVG